jgi:eukaryotic-like serine/threonine-protein kinase
VTPQKWQQIKDVFQSAVELEKSQRTSFLDEACRGNLDLRNEVERLIGLHEQAGDFIETPASDSTISLNLFDQPTPPLVGRRLGSYEIVKEIGHGGMGAVYLGIRADEQYQKRVAIKLIKAGIDSTSVIRRFRNERQILASLDHPGIAKLLDGGTTDDGLPYFVMDYIEGEPIDEYCDNHKLTTVERLKLFRAVCASIQYAHQNLVVHRDIKPNNILITAEGAPKLLDFGIAKVMNPELARSALDMTMTGLAPLTPAYASPEQVRGDPITTVSDVYSLGVVLYVLLTGHAPYRFKSHDRAELVQVICQQEPQRPSTAIRQSRTDGSPVTLTPEVVSRTREGEPDRLRRKLEGDLDNIVLMAMRKEPQRRYASVEQFSEDIRRHLEGLPVIARKDTFGYRSTKFVKRHKAGVIAAMLIIASLITGLVATLWQAHIAKIERAEAELRFNDVRRLANSFLFEFHDAIENLPGSTPARELVVKRALEYLDSLAQKSSSDPSLQRELATAYQRVADIQGNQYSAHSGDTEGALINYKKALAIREKLVAARPTDTDARRELADSCEKLGDISELKGDLNGALEFYRRSLSIRSALSEENPTNALLRQDLAISLDSIADTLLKTGDAQTALDDVRKALAIRQSLSAADPNNITAKRNLAISYYKVAEMLSALDNNSESVEYGMKALAAFEQLAAADPTNAKARRELSVSYNRTGDLLWASDDKSGALARYRQSLKIREELSAADPTNAQATRDLAIGYGNVGSTLAALGDEAETSEKLSKSLRLFEALSAKDPANAVARRDVAVCYTTIADAQTVLASFPSMPAAKQEQHWREARSWYKRGLDLFVELHNLSEQRSTEADQPEKIFASIKKCDEALARLRNSAHPGK